MGEYGGNMGPIWGDMGVFVLQQENIKPLMHRPLIHTRSARRNRHHALLGILQESDPGEVRARSGVARSGPPWKIPQVGCTDLLFLSCADTAAAESERSPVWRGTAVTATAVVDTYAQTHRARSGLTAPHNTHSSVFKSCPARHSHTRCPPPLVCLRLRTAPWDP